MPSVAGATGAVVDLVVTSTNLGVSSQLSYARLQQFVVVSAVLAGSSVVLWQRTPLAREPLVRGQVGRTFFPMSPAQSLTPSRSVSAGQPSSLMKPPCSGHCWRQTNRQQGSREIENKQNHFKRRAPIGHAISFFLPDRFRRQLRRDRYPWDSPGRHHEHWCW